MLLFLATILEQLDLALEHALKREVHNARFALMLVDNAVELVLHQIAKDKSNQLRYLYRLGETYPNQNALNKALGKNFDEKVRFAVVNESLSQVSGTTINIMHEFRNEVYHVGIQHEEILQEITLFYFDVACEAVSKYEPFTLFWISNQKMPERASKYFNRTSFFPGKIEDFRNGCKTLREVCGHDSSKTIQSLADDMDKVIDDQDRCIDIVTEGPQGFRDNERDKAIIETQAYFLALSETGKEFAARNGWAGGFHQLVKWLTENYNFKFRMDPIPSWKKQAARLRSQRDPHAALLHYHSFMKETSRIREELDEAARQIENEINDQIDRLRGK